MINVRRNRRRVCPACGRDMEILRRRDKLYYRYFPRLFIYYTRRMKCGKYPYYKCDSCGHTVLDIPEDINLKYQSNYRINTAMNGDIVNGELGDGYYSNREWILNGRVAKIDSFIEGKKSIFDIGCGGGYVLNYYQKRNHIVAGIEIDDLCVNACRRLGFDCIKGDFLKTDIKEKYDVVMAWHTLEHVSDVNVFIRKMVAITNKNGLIIIEIPVDRGLIRAWKSYNGHVHYFTKESLEKLAEKYNLKCLYHDEGVQKPAWLFIGEIK